MEKIQQEFIQNIQVELEKYDRKLSGEESFLFLLPNWILKKFIQIPDKRSVIQALQRCIDILD